MGNLISIPNDTSLKKLVALGNKLEEVLQEQFGIYGVTWECSNCDYTEEY